MNLSVPKSDVLSGNETSNEDFVAEHREIAINLRGIFEEGYRYEESVQNKCGAFKCERSSSTKRMADSACRSKQRGVRGKIYRLEVVRSI